MAEGLGNAEIADQAGGHRGGGAQARRNVFAKLDLAPGDSGHRRVLAVLAHLGL